MPTHLRLDPIACEGHGNCHELLPEMIGLDRWGYPIQRATEVPRALLRDARRAVALCPKRALALERRSGGDARGPR
jgi:ferredoxin